MSSTPAFSPGPCSRRGLSAGSSSSVTLECLYPQCSDHITPNIRSSSGDGSRPSRRRISSYSSRVRPTDSGASVAVVIYFGPLVIASPEGAWRSPRLPRGCAPRNDGGDHRFEEQPPVTRSKHLFRRSLGVGHEPDHIACRIAHGGDVADRPVGVGVGGDTAVRIAVSKDHLPGLLNRGQQ